MNSESPPRDRIKCGGKPFFAICFITICTLLLIVYYESLSPITKEKLHFKSQFNIASTDVMVFLHIQKTGGSTLGRHLVRDLKIECFHKPNRRKSYHCYRPNTTDSSWLFSRFTSGWKCGLHADWTSLKECVHTKLPPLSHGERRYHYFTMLREPVSRYLSEWKHVARGATWKMAYLLCNGTHHDFPVCYQGWNWENVSLIEFMSCERNIANNRQTWMLADLRKVSCLEGDFVSQERDRIMLESAKENLKAMPFFGLTERQKDSQFLFEYAFDLEFKINFTDFGVTHASMVKLGTKTEKEIRELNKLDSQLYKFAEKLFEARLLQAKEETVDS